MSLCSMPHSAQELNQSQASPSLSVDLVLAVFSFLWIMNSDLRRKPTFQACTEARARLAALSFSLGGSSRVELRMKANSEAT
jgi:hypothetical protein